MSSFVRRMQPDETLVPMVQGSLVPWMRYSVSLLPCHRYMARAPIGLSGPPFMPLPALQLHHVLAQLRLACQHFRGRIPIGPLLLTVDGRKPGPDEAFRPDAYAIA